MRSVRRPASAVRWLLLALLVPGLALAQPGRRGRETTQQGSGARGRPTSAPGPGVEQGTANVTGRTDIGPAGQTGIEGSGIEHERSLARANDQARGENPRGSFLRPADTAPDMNAKVIGSGADYGEFPPGGKYYFDGHARHETGSISGHSDKPPGAAAPQGSAGKSAEPR